MKIRKDKRFITFMGEGADKTRITWHDTSNISHSTFKSASVSVMANGFVARNLAFEVNFHTVFHIAPNKSSFIHLSHICIR